MIWGGGGKIENGFIFSAGKPFFLEKGLRDFFSQVPPGLPQIINGRPLNVCTFKMGIVGKHGDPIPIWLRRVFNSQIKIKCVMKIKNGWTN